MCISRSGKAIYAQNQVQIPLASAVSIVASYLA